MCLLLSVVNEKAGVRIPAVIEKYHPTQGNILRRSLVGKNNILCCGRGYGKALDIDTPILTAKGWLTMGEIQVGDLVFHPSGQYTRVVWKSEVLKDRPCYKLTFSDRSVLVADENHLWYVWDKKYRKNVIKTPHTKLKPQVLTTKTISENIYTYPQTKPEVNYSIPLTSPLLYPKKKTDVPPYVLGCWLGGDSSYRASFCILEDDLKENITNSTSHNKYKWSENISSSGNQILRGLHRDLKKLGYLNKETKFCKKFIPSSYLFNSVECRLELLQGLMDADGTIGENGVCEFINTNFLLADAVFYLLCSLGQKPTITDKVATHYGKKHKKCWQVTFTPSNFFIPFKLKRKIKRLNETFSSILNHRFITSCESVESRPVQCITVESPDGLFLAGKSLITTHNSITGRGLVYLSALSYNGILPPQSKTKLYNVIAMPHLNQAKRIHWEPLEYLFQETPLRQLVKSINRSEGIIQLVGNRPGILLAGLNDDDGNKIRGLSIPRLFLDEFQDMKPTIWAAIKPAVDRCLGATLVCGTPKGKGTHFYKFIKSMIKENWNYYHYFTQDNPYLPNVQEMLRQAKTALTEREYRSEYFASWEEFPGQIFDSLTEDCVLSLSEMPSYLDTVVMGIDWGDVNPAIAIVGIKDFPYKYYLIDHWEGNPDGGNQTIVFDDFLNKALELAEKYQIHSVYPDVFQPGNKNYIYEFRKYPRLSNIVEPDSDDYSNMRELKVMPSLAQLNRLFHQKRFFIKDSIEDQFRSIIRKQDKATGQFLDELDKSGKKHICDATRYAISNIETTINILYGADSGVSYGAYAN